MGDRSDRSQAEPALQATVLAVLVHGVVAVMVLACMVLVVPKFSEIFKSFNMELPALTRVILGMSRAAMFLPVTVPALGGFLALDALIYYGLARSGNASGARLWWWMVLGIEVLAVVAIILALFLPHIPLLSAVGQQGAGQ